MAREFAELGRVPTGPAAPVDVGEMLDEVAKSHPENIEVAVEKQGALVMQGHYEHLHRAVRNLVNNAIEALQDRRPAAGAGGSGSPAAGGRRRIVLGARPLSNGAAPTIEITVRDNGPGVRPQDLAHVFEPHFTTRSSGTGLGLAIVKQTVRHHGGSIRLTSEEGRGTTVTIELPLDAPHVA
jgi:signal transduction histidine kinase